MKDDFHDIDEEYVYWLALNQNSHYFSYSLIEKALNQFSSLTNLFQADTRTLSHLGFNNKSITELLRLKNETILIDFKKLIFVLETKKIKIIRFIDKEYPQKLKKIPNPPLMLFHKGSEIKFDQCVAIVGTRDCSFHGRSMARALSHKLADKGYTIVSGLARGVDEEAHCGALESKYGKTFASLAWFDPIYPPEHSELIKEIERRGARISETFSKGFGSFIPAKFVERNRITSGISEFVIIIETGEDGGTIRQAELAHKQGKSIYVYIPKESDRAYRGFSSIIEKYNGIIFRDIEDLLNKISNNKQNHNKKLSEFNITDQMKLQ